MTAKKFEPGKFVVFRHEGKEMVGKVLYPVIADSETLILEVPVGNRGVTLITDTFRVKKSDVKRVLTDQEMAGADAVNRIFRQVNKK